MLSICSVVHFVYRIAACVKAYSLLSTVRDFYSFTLDFYNMTLCDNTTLEVKALHRSVSQKPLLSTDFVIFSLASKVWLLVKKEEDTHQVKGDTRERVYLLNKESLKRYEREKNHEQVKQAEKRDGKKLKQLAKQSYSCDFLLPLVRNETEEEEKPSSSNHQVHKNSKDERFQTRFSCFKHNNGS